VRATSPPPATGSRSCRSTYHVAAGLVTFSKNASPPFGRTQKKNGDRSETTSVEFVAKMVARVGA
jgi:hypothetical protein